MCRNEHKISFLWMKNMSSVKHPFFLLCMQHFHSWIQNEQFFIFLLKNKIRMNFTYKQNTRKFCFFFFFILIPIFIVYVIVAWRKMLNGYQQVFIHTSISYLLSTSLVSSNFFFRLASTSLVVGCYHSLFRYGMNKFSLFK